jgi:hypothetical protein
MRAVSAQAQRARFHPAVPYHKPNTGLVTHSIRCIRRRRPETAQTKYIDRKLSVLITPPSSQLKNLIRPRHFDASVDKICRELPHDVFFAVNKERTFCACLLLPSQQLRLVGMCGETINGVDASPKATAPRPFNHGAITRTCCARNGPPNGVPSGPSWHADSWPSPCLISPKVSRRVTAAEFGADAKLDVAAL